MAVTEGEKPTPNPEAPAPAAKSAVDATKDVGPGPPLFGSLVPGFLPILSAAYPFRTQCSFQDWLSLRVRPRSRHQVSAAIPHMGRSYARSPICDLRPLHALGLHSRLEAE